MSVPVTTTGDFDLEAYSYQTSVPLSRIETALSRLLGPSGMWNVTVHDPDKSDPHGRISITHDAFNEHTEIVITSLYDGKTTSYSVFHPMETDILTEAENVSALNALETAVRVANREVRRQTRLAPALAVTDRIRNVIP